jgi:hypothetical protein
MKKNINGQEIELTTEEENIIISERQTYKDGEFERKLNKLRLIRNVLLANSDWEVTMAKEKGTTLSSAFKTWRQDLRDITDGLTTVEEVEAVEFPEKPE